MAAWELSEPLLHVISQQERTALTTPRTTWESKIVRLIIHERNELLRLSCVLSRLGRQGRKMKEVARHNRNVEKRFSLARHVDNVRKHTRFNDSIIIFFYAMALYKKL